MGTQAIKSFRPPAGLNQPMRRHNSPGQGMADERRAGPAISGPSSVISPTVKSMATLDPTGIPDAMGSRLRFSPTFATEIPTGPAMGRR